MSWLLRMYTNCHSTWEKKYLSSIVCLLHLSPMIGFAIIIRTSLVRLLITFSLFKQFCFLFFHSVVMVGHQFKRIKSTVSKDIAAQGILSTFTTSWNLINDLLMPPSITAQKMKFFNKYFFSNYEKCGFGHIYWRNLLWKTSFFCVVYLAERCVFNFFL